MENCLIRTTRAGQCNDTQALEVQVERFELSVAIFSHSLSIPYFVPPPLVCESLSHEN